MKMRNGLSKALTLLGIFGLAMAFAAVWHSTRARAFNPQPDPPAFAAVGITNGQTALLTARLETDERRGGRDAQPVEVELLFHDSDGNVLASSVQIIGPERAVSFALDGGTLPLRGDGMRFELQPRIKVLRNPNEAGQTRLIGGLEVFDNSGPDAGKSRFAFNASRTN